MPASDQAVRDHGPGHLDESGDVRAEARADGTLDDIFTLQDDIATQLSVAIGGARPAAVAQRRARHTSNLEAYRAAVEGRLLLESLDAERLAIAEADVARV